MSLATTILPMLSIRRGAEAIEFYKAAFGAREVYHLEDSSGAVVSRLAMDSAEFWLNDESPDMLISARSRWEVVPSVYY